MDRHGVSDEIPQAANRVVGGVGHRVRAADRVVGAELLASVTGFILHCHQCPMRCSLGDVSEKVR